VNQATVTAPILDSDRIRRLLAGLRERSLDSAGRPNARQLSLVWGVWAVLTCQAVAFVATNAVDFPYFDEWEMIPVLSGHEPLTFSWLWSQHNEHRIVLARLLYLLVERLSDYDFRAGMFVNAVAMSAGAAVLIDVVRRERGRTEYSDAFFPLLLLNLGQAQTFTNGFQMALIIWTLLTLGILVVIMRRGSLSFRWALAFACAVALEPLLGGPGVTIVPVLALSVGISAWSLRHQPGSRYASAIVLGVTGIAVALTAFYFHGYVVPAKHPGNPSPLGTVNATIQFLTTGFGSAARLWWPMTKWLCLLALVAVAAAGWLVVRGRPDERPRALRLGSFCVALLGLAIATAWARSVLSNDALFASRYAALAAPFWCGIYFVWELVDRPRLRRVGQAALFLCSALLLVPNRRDGDREAIFFRDVRQDAIDDIAAGVPLDQLVRHHHDKLYYGAPDVLAERMRMLRARRIGVFESLKD
jgi:hypothetical protein